MSWVSFAEPHAHLRVVAHVQVAAALPHAATLLVAARTDNGVSLFHLNGDADGLTRTALATMDQTRKQSKITFDNTPATLIGAEGAGGPCLSGSSTWPQSVLPPSR